MLVLKKGGFMFVMKRTATLYKGDAKIELRVNVFRDKRCTEYIIEGLKVYTYSPRTMRFEADDESYITLH